MVTGGVFPSPSRRLPFVFHCALGTAFPLLVDFHRINTIFIPRRDTHAFDLSLSRLSRALSSKLFYFIDDKTIGQSLRQQSRNLQIFLVDRFCYIFCSNVCHIVVVLVDAWGSSENVYPQLPPPLLSTKLHRRATRSAERDQRQHQPRSHPSSHPLPNRYVPGITCTTSMMN